MCTAASGRQIRPIARPAITPRRAPLASMRVADEGLAGQATAQLCQRLVVDRWQLAHLECSRTAFREQLLERTHDPWIELDALVLGELFQRAVVADRLPIDTVGGHRLV